MIKTTAFWWKVLFRPHWWDENFLRKKKWVPDSKVCMFFEPNPFPKNSKQFWVIAHGPRTHNQMATGSRWPHCVCAKKLNGERFWVTTHWMRTKSKMASGSPWARIARAKQQKGERFWVTGVCAQKKNGEPFQVTARWPHKKITWWAILGNRALNAQNKSNDERFRVPAQWPRNKNNIGWAVRGNRELLLLQTVIWFLLLSLRYALRICAEVLRTEIFRDNTRLCC